MPKPPDPILSLPSVHEATFEHAAKLEKLPPESGKRRYLLKTGPQLKAAGLSFKGNVLLPEQLEELHGLVADAALEDGDGVGGWTRGGIIAYLKKDVGSGMTRLSTYVRKHFRDGASFRRSARGQALTHLEELKVGSTAGMTEDDAEEYLRLVEDLRGGDLPGLSEQEADSWMRKIIETTGQLCAIDMTPAQLKYHVRKRAGKLVRKIKGLSKKEKKIAIKNTMVAIMKPILNARVFYTFGKQLLVDGRAFAYDVYDPEVEEFRPSFNVMMLEELLRQICQGASFAKTGEYDKGQEGHDLHPDPEYMVDLLGARVFDLRATYSVPRGSGDGGYGVPIFGRSRIMREIAYTYTEEEAKFRVMIRMSKAEIARKPKGRHEYTLQLHRLVHILARNHGISIYAPGGLEAAGLGNIAPADFEARFNYEPLHRSDYNDAKAIRLAQRLHKRGSRECDVDHCDGRTERQSNGLVRSGPESHRLNICLAEVRRLVRDWCCGLLVKPYLGGKITVCSKNEITEDVIEDMIEEAGNGEPVLHGLDPLDMETMRRTDLEQVVEEGGKHRWDVEDGDDEDRTWEANIYDADTVKNQAVECECCELTACGFWSSPGEEDWCLCLDCSEIDQLCNDISLEDAEDADHWKAIEKFCSHRKNKRRRK